VIFSETKIDHNYHIQLLTLYQKI